jgi:hypothetical protein
VAILCSYEKPSNLVCTTHALLKLDVSSLAIAFEDIFLQSAEAKEKDVIFDANTLKRFMGKVWLIQFKPRSTIFALRRAAPGLQQETVYGIPETARKEGQRLQHLTDKKKKDCKEIFLVRSSRDILCVAEQRNKALQTA